MPITGEMQEVRPRQESGKRELLPDMVDSASIRKFCNGYNSAFDCDEDCSADDFNEGFIDGAQWRINSVWHDREEQPEVERWFIFKADDTNPFKKPTIKKIAYYTNRIENDKGLDWLKMVAEYKILCWAYVDDLLPERKEDAE